MSRIISQHLVSFLSLGYSHVFFPSYMFILFRKSRFSVRQQFTSSLAYEKEVKSNAE